MQVLAAITTVSVGLAIAQAAVSTSFEQRRVALVLFVVTNISIAVNLVLYVLISLKISRMAFSSKSEPVLVLSARLKYYPLIEIILRIGTV